MVPLYADEDVPLGLINELRAIGYDVLRAHEAGRAGQGIPDHAQLGYATQVGRVMLTKNRRHFHILHNQSTLHGGIVTFTDDMDRPALAKRVHEKLLESQTHAGRLMKVVRPATQP